LAFSISFIHAIICHSLIFCIHALNATQSPPSHTTYAAFAAFFIHSSLIFLKSVHIIRDFLISEGLVIHHLRICLMDCFSASELANCDHNDVAISRTLVSISALDNFSFHAISFLI
jgi:hypothetical protein